MTAIPGPNTPLTDATLNDLIGVVANVVIPAMLAAGAVWLGLSMFKLVLRRGGDPMTWSPDDDQQPETDCTPMDSDVPWNYDTHPGWHSPEQECSGCRLLFAPDEQGQVYLGNRVTAAEAQAWYAGFRACAALMSAEPDHPVDEVEHSSWPTR